MHRDNNLSVTWITGRKERQKEDDTNDSKVQMPPRTSWQRRSILQSKVTSRGALNIEQESALSSLVGRGRRHNRAYLISQQTLTPTKGKRNRNVFLPQSAQWFFYCSILLTIVKRWSWFILTSLFISLLLSSLYTVALFLVWICGYVFWSKTRWTEGWDRWWLDAF